MIFLTDCICQSKCADLQVYLYLPPYLVKHATRHLSFLDDRLDLLTIKLIKKSSGYLFLPVLRGYKIFDFIFGN